MMRARSWTTPTTTTMTMTMTTVITTVLATLGLVACSAQDRPSASPPSVTEANPPTFAGDDQSQAQSASRKPDVIFVPTPEPVVQRMLTMAKVGPNDVVYDLGCGDGRIVIAAARDFGARSLCIDIDPQRVREARANVKRAGLEDRVEVRQGDMFQLDTSPASVVTLYLLESLNMKLRPKLQRELAPGSRIVSQSFSMGDWKPDQRDAVNGTPVYLWRVGGEVSAR